MSLLRKPNEPLPPGCYCEPGHCSAPRIMGMQMPCRDPEKAKRSSLALGDWRVPGEIQGQTGSAEGFIGSPPRYQKE